MISINPLGTKVLITTDEVIFHAPVNNTVDPRILLQSIIIAERRFIKPMIGAVIYKGLLDAKNTLVTADNKATLQTSFNDARTGRAPYTLQIGDHVSDDSKLSAAQLELWKDYLHKITAECVYFCALPSNRARFGTEGVMLNAPASAMSSATVASIDLKDLKHLMDRELQDRIAPLIEDMHQYLCTSSFSGYTKDCNCDSDGVAYKKKSDILFGMYDDEDDCKPNRYQ